MAPPAGRTCPEVQASWVILCFAVDSISLTPLHKILPDGLLVADTNWLHAVFLLAPFLCAVVAAHDAITNLCINNPCLLATSNLQFLELSTSSPTWAKVCWL